MRILDLKSGHKVLIDDVDWATATRGAVYVGPNGYAYVSRWVDGRSRPNTLHAEIMGVLAGHHIDHINGNKLDNRRSNLRHVSYMLNQVNRKALNRNNSSGARGVTARRTKTAGVRWIAQIGIPGHGSRYLGSFSTLDEAIQARREAELLHFGELCP